MSNSSPALSPAQIESFIADGVVKIEGAFPRPVADACCDILWRDLKLSPEAPEAWLKTIGRAVPDLAGEILRMLRDRGAITA